MRVSAERISASGVFLKNTREANGRFTMQRRVGRKVRLAGTGAGGYRARHPISRLGWRTLRRRCWLTVAG